MEDHPQGGTPNAPSAPDQQDQRMQRKMRREGFIGPRKGERRFGRQQQAAPVSDALEPAAPQSAAPAEGVPAELKPASAAAEASPEPPDTPASPAVVAPARPPEPAEAPTRLTEAVIIPLREREAVPAPVSSRPPVKAVVPEPRSVATPVPSPRSPELSKAAKPVPGATEPASAPPRARPQVPMAGPARLRKRHYLLGLTFLMSVVATALVSAWYLWGVALDQYASRLGFSVQREEAGAAIEILGGISELSGSSSSDTDILYKYMQSRELIAKIDDKLDLVSIFTRPEDPLYSLPANPTIEDLEEVWGTMVAIFYDTSSHLIEVRVRAFTPEDARAIADAILAESTAKLNEITSAGRADATKYARDELETAKNRLGEARKEITAFRIRTQIVDPVADVQGRMGLLNNLLSQQATALIELDLVAATASPNDPRYIQAQRRVEVIEARIREERARFGDRPAEEDQRYAELVASFEELSAEVEFAQRAYLTALATYDAAQAEAQRKSRYLATYLPPTTAERAEFPERLLLFLLATGAALALWTISVLVYYTLRDRI